MMKTYLQVIKQIEGLQVEADKLRRKEMSGVIARIREAIEHYGLTAADLGFAVVPRKPAAAKKAGKARSAKPGAAPAAPRFRDEAGHVWGGRGPRPKWLREALIAGRKLEEFRVD